MEVLYYKPRNLDKGWALRTDHTHGDDGQPVETTVDVDLYRPSLPGKY